VSFFLYPFLPPHSPGIVLLDSRAGVPTGPLKKTPPRRFNPPFSSVHYPPFVSLRASPGTRVFQYYCLQCPANFRSSFLPVHDSPLSSVSGRHLISFPRVPLRTSFLHLQPLPPFFFTPLFSPSSQAAGSMGNRSSPLTTPREFFTQYFLKLF